MLTKIVGGDKQVAAKIAANKKIGTTSTKRVPTTWAQPIAL